MENVVKLEDSEFAMVLSFHQNFNNLTKQFGELHYQKKNLELAIVETDIGLERIIEERNKMVKQLQDKYGPGQIDLSTGTFIPDVSKK